MHGWCLTVLPQMPRTDSLYKIVKEKHNALGY
jgi:hypothetical protein